MNKAQLSPEISAEVLDPQNKIAKEMASQRDQMASYADEVIPDPVVIDPALVKAFEQAGEFISIILACSKHFSVAIPDARLTYRSCNDLERNALGVPWISGFHSWHICDG